MKNFSKYLIVSTLALTAVFLAGAQSKKANAFPANYCESEDCVPTVFPTPILPTIIITEQTNTCTGSGCGCICNTTPTPTASPSATPLVTPTPTATPSATPTPTSTPSNTNSNPSSPKVSTPIVQAAKAEIKTTKMAATGSFISNIMNSLFAFGILLISSGWILYAKTKKAYAKA